MTLLKELYNYRAMTESLVRRELRGRYKASFLGFLWTFINPLLQLMVYTLVFTTIFKTDIEKYYLHLFVALIPWLFFATCLQGGTTAVVSQKDLVVKIYFPRQVLPIAFAVSSFVNMLLCFIVIFAVLIFSGVGLSLNIVYLPAIMAIQFFLCLGICMLASALNVYFRDLEHILGIITMAWMYFSPIVYSINVIPANMMGVYMLNPMTPIIIAYRDVLYYGRAPELSTLAGALLSGMIVCVLGFAVFGKLQKGFAEEL